MAPQLADSTPLTFRLASQADVPALARLHAEAAARLDGDFGTGHWSTAATEVSVARGIRTSKVIVACDREGLAGTLRLATKKPWAIDPAFFASVKKPLYLLDMAVAPARQRSGVGRRLLEEAEAIARVWPADALRLDAYDAPAGAGGFYARCGFTEVGSAAIRGVPLIYFEKIVSRTA